MRILRPEATDPPDEVLIQRSMLVPEHFAVLFDRHAPAVHHYLARRVGPVSHLQAVQVNGRPGQLFQAQGSWLLQAPLPDGSAFTLQAPTTLTSRQVIAIADQVRRG